MILQLLREERKKRFQVIISKIICRSYSSLEFFAEVKAEKQRVMCKLTLKLGFVVAEVLKSVFIFVV